MGVAIHMAVLADLKSGGPRHVFARHGPLHNLGALAGAYGTLYPTRRVPTTRR